MSSSLEGLLIGFTKLIGADVSGYIDIESSDDLDPDNATLLSRTSSLITLIAIDGFRYLGGDEEFGRLVRALDERLTSLLSMPGHRFNVFFSSDPTGFRVESRLDQYMAPSRRTATKLQMDATPLLRSRADKLTEICQIEEVMLAVWTLPEGLTKQEHNKHKKTMLRAAKEFPPPYMRDSQKLRYCIPELRRRHRAACMGLMETLRGVDVITRKLDCHKALAWLRANLSSDTVSPGWKARLPGDRLVVRNNRRLLELKDDISAINYPIVADQLIVGDATVFGELVSYDGHLYSPMQVALPPQSPRAFNRLFNELRHYHIPWRIMFTLDGAGLASVKLKTMLASFMTFVPPNNKRLRDAVNDLTHLNDEGVGLAAFKINLCTWVRGETITDLEQLRSQGSLLQRAVEGWGVADVRPAKGDPFLGMLSSLPGPCKSPAADEAVAPIYDAVAMMPVFRPASIWPSGSLLYRTPDGKPWPFQPGSGLQTHWVNLIFAPPGSGKSVHMGAMNTSLCLAPGLKRLPYIHIIDIGATSRWWIEFMRAMLPPNQRNLAAYYRLRNQPEYAINIFDLQLGYTRPLPSEMAFIENFVSLMLTLPGKPSPPEAVMAVVRAAVSTAYNTLAPDSEKPKPYTPEANKEVDEMLEKWNIVPKTGASWWDVVYALIDVGDHHAASLAQRSAVPVLADIASAVRQPNVAALAGDAKVSETNEDVIKYINRSFSERTRKYPILAVPTRFDLGETRLVALDLDEVAKGEGEEGAKQRAMMYMVARNTARHYYLTEDDLAECPPQVKDYHTQRIRELRETHKHLCYDEFHRTGSAHGDLVKSTQVVRQQIQLDMREGRKWGVMLSLLSQSLLDFDEVTVDLASTIYVMGASGGKVADKIQKTFGLKDAAHDVLANRLTGPGPEGAPFLGVFRTKSGEVRQLLKLALGALEIWAYSTTVEDVALRQRVCAELGTLPALERLAERYPRGSAKQEVELLREQASEDASQGDIDDNIYDTLARQVIADG